MVDVIYTHTMYKDSAKFRGKKLQNRQNYFANLTEAILSQIGT